MMQETHSSLRLRLLKLVGVPIILAGIVIGGLALVSTYREIDEVYDAQLAQEGKLLLQITEHQLEEDEKRGVKIDMEKRDLSHFYERKLSFRIWLKDKLVIQSPSATGFGPKPAPTGLSSREEENHSWRFFAVFDDDADLLVEVAEDNDIRTDLILQILSSLFVPSLIFIPMILVIVWLGTTRSLKPVVALSQQVNLRGAQDLTSLPTAEIPREVLPFVDALNQMLSRFGLFLQREREFTDNAAHELRTPLAAMKTQAQVLLKKAAHMPDCQEDLNHLISSIDRAAHMVDQLLTFSRLQNAQDVMADIDFSALVEESLRETFPALEAKKQSLDVQVDPGIRIRGAANTLRILVRNLVDNAQKYTPAKGRVAVTLSRSGGNTLLVVSDTGPGIPEELQGKVFNRFYRVNKASGTGSGLGLGMVKWIADVHRAAVSLKNATPHGLIVTLSFPDEAPVTH